MTRKKQGKDATGPAAGDPLPGLVAPVNDPLPAPKKAKPTRPGAVPETADPLGDLLAAEAIIDLVRLGMECDLVAGATEARQDSAAVAAGHALYLVRRARLSVAEALAYRFASALPCRPAPIE